MSDILSQRIVCIEKVVLRGKRPRTIGHNARLPAHGPDLADPVVRIHTDEGVVGVGWSRVLRKGAEKLIGRRIDELFQLPDGSTEAGHDVDLVLWDLVARAMGKPLYQLLGAKGSREVEMYDGSIYIDDLGASDQEAVQIFQQEVKSGQEHGYRNFKIKVGRGARWMPPSEGMARDILVVQTVREAAGPDAKILIDANMGNTLNSAKELLAACADIGIHWFEEPFAEDGPLNGALKAFILDNDYDALVADGEFAPPPNFFDLVRQGWIDVVQHDFRMYGLTWWKALAPRLHEWGARCGPHCWGSFIERYAHAHFAASVPNYALLEAAPAEVPGIMLDGWEVRDGMLIVPDTPGTGFDVDSETIKRELARPEAFSLPA